MSIDLTAALSEATREQMEAALRDILRLHTPGDTDCVDESHDDDCPGCYTGCAQCLTEDQGELVPQEWPCWHVRIIEERLVPPDSDRALGLLREALS